MPADKMKKQLRSVRAEEKLLQFILNEPIPVGAKIPNEYELARQFEVSRSTIRESVRSLVSKGILEVRRGDGTYVMSTQAAEEDPLGLSGHGSTQEKLILALDLLEVRLILEPEIAARAASCASSEQKETLQALCDACEKDILLGKDHLGPDMEFHEFIARCSGNQIMESLSPIICRAVQTFGDLTLRRYTAETVRTHRAITKAICEGDAVGAKCAMINHLTYNRDALRAMREV